MFVVQRDTHKKKRDVSYTHRSILPMPMVNVGQFHDNFGGLRPPLMHPYTPTHPPTHTQTHTHTHLHTHLDTHRQHVQRHTEERRGKSSQRCRPDTKDTKAASESLCVCVYVCVCGCGCVCAALCDQRLLIQMTPHRQLLCFQGPAFSTPGFYHTRLQLTVAMLGTFSVVLPHLGSDVGL